jgi:hypothetical protein
MYRLRGITKRESGGRKRRYKNLASFNKECPKRGYSGNLCTLTNVRCVKDGGGLATVKTTRFGSGRSTKPPGTWLLHFASCKIMKSHLRGRAHPSRPEMLLGRRR